MAVFADDGFFEDEDDDEDENDWGGLLTDQILVQGTI
jgi:hypothetical protein